MMKFYFKVGEKELRSAMYYPYLIRYRRSLYLLAFAILAALFCFLGARIGLFGDLFVVYFIAIAYLIYMVFVFGRAEQVMGKYLRAPDCLVGKQYVLTLDKQNVRICVEANRSDETFALASLDHIAEMKNIFLIHVKDAQVFILPKFAVKDEDLDKVRAIFSGALKERFIEFYLFPWRHS